MLDQRHEYFLGHILGDRVARSSARRNGRRRLASPRYRAVKASSSPVEHAPEADPASLRLAQSIVTASHTSVSNSPVPQEQLKFPDYRLWPATLKNKMTYDVIVIGSGPGGYSAAVRAGQYGLKTAIIEKDPKLGGTCLHVGCIPTKAFLHAADVWERFLHSAEDGIHCDNPRLDFPLVSDRKNKIVAKHSKGVEFLMKKNKVDWIKGTRASGGPWQGRGHLGRGARSWRPTTSCWRRVRKRACFRGLQPDAKRILTNIEILDLTEVPKSMAIIGAGAVGVEFASCFHRFGTKVTLFEMLPRIVPRGGRRGFEGTRARCSRRAASASRPARAVENIQKYDNGRPILARLLRTASRRTSKSRRCWSRWAGSRSRTTSASKARASSSTAGS